MSAGLILVVDDDPQIRRVLKVTLSGQGFEVDDAKNGEEALERLRERRVDLVLLDINMPGMSGLDVCRAMRATSEVAIIMLTVRDEEADTVEALDAGADDYVTKPFKPTELSARIRAALRRSPGGQGPAGRLELGPATIDFDTRQVTSRGRQRPADAEGVRPAPVPRRARQQGALAPPAPAGGLGTRLRRPGGLPARVREPAPEEDRAEAVEPDLPADRALGRLPVPPPAGPAVNGRTKS